MQSKSAIGNAKLDVHGSLMKAYKQVPEWWFQILLFGSMAVSIVIALVWKTDVQLPWWGMIFAFALAFVVTLPVGVILATTNQVDTNSMFSSISIVSYYFDVKRETIQV
jgi:hypothetical protein